MELVMALEEEQLILRWRAMKKKITTVQIGLIVGRPRVSNDFCYAVTRPPEFTLSQIQNHFSEDKRLPKHCRVVAATGLGRLFRRQPLL